MSGSLKKDLDTAKNSEAKDLGIQDFFNFRDKSRRGSDGLIGDASQQLDKEIQTKEELYEKSLEVTSLPEHVMPLFSGVFLTARRNKITENGLYLPTAFDTNNDLDMDVDFSDTQIVLACGMHANQVAPGMEVVLNMDNFKQRLGDSMAQRVNKEYKYNIPVKIIDGTEYIYVTERDISYISNTNGFIIKNK